MNETSSPQFFFVFELAGLGSGLQLVNDLVSQLPTLDVLEATLMAPQKFVGLFAGLESDFSRARASWATVRTNRTDAEITDCAWISAIDPRLAAGLYQLNAATCAADYLAVLEFSSLAQTLRICQRVLTELGGDVELIDMRTYRSGFGGCAAIFAGADSALGRVQATAQACAREADHGMAPLTCQLVGPVSQKFAQYFGLPEHGF